MEQNIENYMEDTSYVTSDSFSLATNESWIDSENEKQERTEWHNIVLRNKAAEICEKYLSKGDKVYIEGRIKTRKWQDDKGLDRYSTEINCTEFTFLSNKQDSQGEMNSNTPSNNQEADASSSEDTSSSDDLPF